jgi:hypothetical protein
MNNPNKAAEQILDLILQNARSHMDGEKVEDFVLGLVMDLKQVTDTSPVKEVFDKLHKKLFT